MSKSKIKKWEPPKMRKIIINGGPTLQNNENKNHRIS